MIEIEDPAIVEVTTQTVFQIRVGGMDPEQAEQYAEKLVLEALEKLRAELSGRVLH